MKGFTLLEVMIVVVLIGIISSMTLLAMGSSEQNNWQQQEAERLLELFKLTSQEAMVAGSPIAVQLFSNGYRFLQLQDQHWQPEQRDALFRQRTLPPKLHLGLQLDNQNIVLKPITQASNVEAQLVFTPDGDISRFQIHISLDGSTERLSLTNTLKDGLIIKAPTAKQKP